MATLNSLTDRARGRVENPLNWCIGVERNRGVAEVKTVPYTCSDLNEILVHNDVLQRCVASVQK